MKYSRYNFISKVAEDKSIIYNSVSNQVLVLLPEIVRLLRQNKYNLQNIRTIHPEFYHALSTNKFIVDDACDEYQAVVRKILAVDTNDTYSITINPTLNCNLSCWYCYEKHIESKMPPDVYKNIVSLIEKHVVEQNISISFFGGEPLLAFEDMVIPLLDEARTLCKQHSKKLSISFTSNGVLLTHDRIQKLLHYTEHIGFQIALDGDATHHNKVKYLYEKREGTYAITIANIKEAISHQISVIVRCNYTSVTIDSFMNVLKDFKEITAESKSYLRFDFQRIWQDHNANIGKIKRQQITNIIAFARMNDLPVSEGRDALYLGTKCYADDDLQFVINYNGDLYKCTAQDFVADNSIGHLHENGSMTFNEKYKAFLANRFPNKKCAKCSIFPICMGGCYRTRITMTQMDSCPLAYSNSKKRNIIQHRVQILLSKND